MTTSTPFRDLLHAANLRHGTDGITSPPKEGVLRIFSPLKIRRLRPGLNPRTWVLKASTLPLDHRSRYIYIYIYIYINNTLYIIITVTCFDASVSSSGILVLLLYFATVTKIIKEHVSKANAIFIACGIK